MRHWFHLLDKGWIAALCGLGLPIAVSAALAPFRGNFALPASALVLVLVVVAVGSFGNRFAGILAALSAAAWFDFFLTKPYETFNITHRPDLETEISLLVVGLAITEIAARSRGHREDATEEAHNLALDSRVHRDGGLRRAGAVRHRPARPPELTSLLGLKECRFETEMSDGHPTRIEHFGVVTLGGLRWGAEQTGLPGHEVRASSSAIGARPSGASS